jgi:DNA-binding response OmpR family regulator
MPLTLIRILLVDDDEAIRSMMDEVLQQEGCIVTTAANVPDALKLISSNVYDVLLSDLHMPDLGDGLTVVSAMRHANPKAVTMILSAFPEMDAASHAIMLQADQVLVKPMNVRALVKAIKERLTTGAPPARMIVTVATILERTVESTIKDWFEHIRKDDKVMAVPLTYEQRTSHLPQVLNDLVKRLRSSQPIGSKELVSAAAAEHGINRHKQGYSSAMMVEESRMLQVSVFHTLQKNLAQIDFSILLTDVMTIADEIDSQLSQAMTSYVAASVGEVAT